MRVGAIEEAFVNATEGHIIDRTVCTDLLTSDPGELFRLCQREHGRCVSSIYIDTDEGTKRVGWVFEAIDRYQDTGERYLREVWITLLERVDTVERTLHLAYL